MNQNKAQKPLPCIRQKLLAILQKIRFFEIDIDPLTGRQIAVIMHHAGRNDQKISAVQVIETVVDEKTADERMYNLNGQRINGLNAQKGIYIKNGKKYAR